MSASQSVSQSHDQSVIQSASRRVSQSLTAFSKYMYGSIWEVMVHFFEKVILFFFFDRTMYMKKNTLLGMFLQNIDVTLKL